MMSPCSLRDGPVLDGPVLEGPVLEGPVLEGPVLDGPGVTNRPAPRRAAPGATHARKESRLRAVLAPAVLVLSGLLAATSATAQPRSFNCVGAEKLEDDVFEIGFAQSSARPGRETRSPVAAAAEIAKADPTRNICVLGHAVREGGQASSTRLAARRAREVAEVLSVQYGIERDRIRAEARNPGFSNTTANREARSVTIVVMPARP